MIVDLDQMNRLSIIFSCGCASGQIVQILHSYPSITITPPGSFCQTPYIDPSDLSRMAVDYQTCSPSIHMYAESDEKISYIRLWKVQ